MSVIINKLYDITPRCIITVVNWCLGCYRNPRGSYFRYRQSQRKCDAVLTVVFLVHWAEAWNSLKTVYEAAKNRDDINEYIVAVPHPIHGKSMYEYAKPLYDNVIDAYDGDRWFDLRTLNPDVIIQQTPYNQEYPSPYRSNKTSRYAKIVYIPYGQSLSPGVHYNIQFNDRFLSDVYAIFAENDFARKWIINKMKRNIWWRSIIVKSHGHPREDLYCQKSGTHDRITYMYIPRWSLDDENNDKTTWFEYIDFLIEYFQIHKDKKLIIRPHPIMFHRFIQNGVMTQKEVDDIHILVEKTDNIVFDDEKDYLATFNKADIMIADISSIIIEFCVTGKPVLYLSKKARFDNENKIIKDVLINIKDVEELRKYLDMGYKVTEINSDERQRIACELTKNFKGNVGENIIQSLVDMCKINVD